MKKKSSKSIADSVIEYYRGSIFSGELEGEVMLTEFMGINKNQWNTLGVPVIKADLGIRYNLDVSVEALNKCKTFDNLISAIEEARHQTLSGPRQSILNGMIA
ncbi:MAG: hypothetical protein WCV70_02435 [Patescibacteria group bacterium]|jgi:hypothetical protein